MNGELAQLARAFAWHANEIVRRIKMLKNIFLKLV